MIGKVSSRVEIRDLSSKQVTGMSSLRTHTPHRIAHKSLEVRRRGKLRKNMAACIGDARQGGTDSQTGIGDEDV